MSAKPRGSEGWQTRVGVIMAVAGSAVGLGNFLRFPGQAAQNGAGAFMIPYFISLLILGIPLAWAEWTMGRYGGTRGFNSAPGIFAVLFGRPRGRYVGTLGLLIPLVIYMYYVFIEAWCLGYAWNYLDGDLMTLSGGPAAYSKFFDEYVGTGADGFLMAPEATSVELMSLLVLTFGLNFVLIYRGVSKGIETFCKYAMPLMAFCAVCVLIRVLTLPPQEGRTVSDGLGFMWNPEFEALKNPQTWIAAAGQIFFSLSVGFGVIINYASYLSRKDDVALSGATACATNEFFEVCLGGMITLPAAFLFLGATAGTFGTFGLGFHALPNVFAEMPFGRLFGFLWFFMLFLAAITSSISMLQPVIAFLEEGFGLKRHASATLLGLITALGTFFVVYFSKGMAALDSLDFWVGTVGIFVFGLVQSLVYGWIFGIRRGEASLHEGAHIRVPRLIQYVLKYVAPAYLLVIFAAFCWESLPTKFTPVVEFDRPVSATLTDGESVSAAARGAIGAAAERQKKSVDLPAELTVRRDGESRISLVSPEGVALYRLETVDSSEALTARAPGYVEKTMRNRGAAAAFLLICVVAAFLLLLVHIAGRRWAKEGRYDAVTTAEPLTTGDLR